MRRALKILAWVAGVIIAVPLLLVAAVLVLANVDPGRRLIERVTAQVTGGSVRIAGLAGRFPDRLRLAHAEIRDAGGAWLSLDDVALDWTPTALLSRTAQVDRLAVGRIALPRLPVSAPQPAKPAPSGSSGFSLPVRVEVKALHVARLDVGAALAGLPAAVAIDGTADVASLQQGRADIQARRLDGGGTYAVTGEIDPMHITTRLDVQEPPGGLIAGLAHLPDLGGPIAIGATIAGPRSAEATQVALSAGPLRANAKGTVDLADSSAALDVTASAPAMAPRPDLSWQSVAIDAHVHGPFARPDAAGTVRIAGLLAGGATVSALSADIGGNAGQVALQASLAGLRIPGPKPELLAAAPLVLKAQVQLDQPSRPVTFAVAHPLLQADGNADTGGDIKANVNLTLPDLQPLAAIGGVDIQGTTQATARLSVQGPATILDVDGTVGITGGLAPLPGLIGPAARIGATATLNGPDITISRAQVDGKTVTLAATGADRDGALDLDWKAGLTDLSVLAATVNGALRAQGHVQGRQTDLTVNADVTGEVGAPGVPRGPVTVALRAAGMPGKPDATIKASGTLDRSPLAVDATVKRGDDGAIQAAIQQVAWKTARITGDFTLPAGATLPVGRAQVRVARLDDFQPFIGQPVSGSLTADLDTVQEGGHPQARLHLQATGAGIPTARIGRADLQARVTDPTTKPVVAAQLAVDGIQAGGIGGSARLEANGPQDALALRLSAALANLAGADAKLDAAATVDAPGKRVTLASLAADWHGESLRLLSPAHVGFGGGVAVDRLRLGVGAATLDVAGKLTPALDLTAALRNVTPDLAKPFAPDLQADGVISADAKLSGTTAAPAGSVRLAATGLHLRSGPARGLPPANLQATAELHGQSAALDARLAAVAAPPLSLTGQAPLSATGGLNLRANGGLDLALLDPILTPDGRRARGTLTLDLGVAGTPIAPRPTGRVLLANGEVQDFTQGVHVTGINADIEAAGDALRIASFTGHAGTGTISAAGTVGVLQPDLPVNVTVTARNARLLAADRLTADLDADLAVRGTVRRALAAGGTLRLVRATINVPDHLPASVAVLNVRVPGQKPPPPPAAGAAVALDLTVNAPGSAIFVRGRGLDSVLGGRLHVGGTSSAPAISGGFDMQRGTFSLAGTTLTFSRGRVSFDGTGVTDTIDPTLDFEADSTSGGVTAKLLVGGYASAPKITLASDPTLPQDEVLAHLLFGTGTQQLGPFQIASIATGLASISGVGGSAANPLDRIRNGLGLDRLTVGSDSGNSIANSIPNLNQRRTANTTNSTSVQAGRYVANGVYVGAKQGTSGSDTQAEVQIDITKRLKLETDLGSGRGGNNLGLTYQFEY